jgi:hypothetical protein
MKYWRIKLTKKRAKKKRIQSEENKIKYGIWKKRKIIYLMIW